MDRHIITKSDYNAMLFKLKVIASTDIKVSRKFPHYNHGLCGLKRELWGNDYKNAIHLVCPLDLRETPSAHNCHSSQCPIKSGLPDSQIKQIIKDFIIKD